MVIQKKVELNLIDRNTSLPFFLICTSKTHIALGFSLVAAADLRVGSCPMGGFDAKVTTSSE